MKCALIILPKRFNGHELFVLLKVLKDHDIKFMLLSQDEVAVEEEGVFTPGGFRIKTHGIVFNFPVDELIKYSALIFVSGDLNDLEEYWNSNHITNLVKKAVDLNIVIGAVCVSIMNIHSILKGRKSTSYESLNFIERLVNTGATYVPLSVVIDGKLVTGENTLSTQNWAETIVSLILGKNPELNLQTEVGNITHRKRKARKAIPALERLHRSEKDS